MLDAKLQHTLLSLSTPLLADSRVRLGLPETHLDPDIRPVVPFSKMVGTAVTVELEMAPDEEAADLSLMKEAYAFPGESLCPIIVVQVPEEARGYGIVGEGAATVARAHGFVGALVEGTVRDTHELQEMDFPVFSRTISPGYIVGKVSARVIREPVVVGGRTICDGDIIVADNDGVIIVKPEELEAVTALATAINEWEHRVFHQLVAGKNMDEAAELAGPMP